MGRWCRLLSLKSVILQKGSLFLPLGKWSKGDAGLINVDDQLSDEDFDVAVVTVRKHFLGVGRTPDEISAVMAVSRPG